MKPRFLELARRASFLSDHPQHKMGCVVVKGNRVVSLGTNKVKTHPISRHPFKSLHSEMAAVLKADPRDLVGSTVYVYRERKDGSKGLARPCRWCNELLLNAGVSDVIYTIDNPPFFKHEVING